MRLQCYDPKFITLYSKSNKVSISSFSMEVEQAFHPFLTHPHHHIGPNARAMLDMIPSMRLDIILIILLRCLGDYRFPRGNSTTIPLMHDENANNIV